MSSTVEDREEVAQPIKIDLSPKAQQIIRGLKERTGMTQKAAIERLLTWFTAQADSVRDAVLSPTGDAAGELLKLKLVERESAAGLTLDEAIAQARRSIDQVERMSLAYQRAAERKKK